MLSRIKASIAADPWRAASILLGVALVVALSGLIVSMSRPSDEPASEAADPTTPTSAAASPSTTSTSTAVVAPTEDGRGEVTGSMAGGFVAVKVDNAPPARPQVGLAEARLLVEVPVEGGITRFIAVYEQQTDGVVGPVRSLRPVDADLLPLLAPVVVSSGGQPFVLQDVIASGVDPVGPEFPSLFVSAGRADPYDTFLFLDELRILLPESYGEGRGLPSGSLPDGAPAGGPIALPFPGVDLRYEVGIGYARYVDGEPAVTEIAPEGERVPIAHDTVVVLFAAERPAGYSDVNGVPVTAFDVIGSGRLLVFDEGQVVEATWSRAAQADGFVFTDTDGVPFGLPEGRVYLAVVPRELDIAY